jgi:hypothetical protein
VVRDVARRERRVSILRGNGGLMNLSRLSVPDLQARARAIDAQIKKLDHHPRPTPSERTLALELKRLRLTLKDQLAAQQR